MIDRYQLRYFLAVVDHGNFTRAAAACNVSQPTLSVGIAKLEESLGSRLFQRNSQRVRLTQGGARFLVHARRIESEFNLAAHVLTDTSDDPMVRVGVLRSLPGAMLAGIILKRKIGIAYGPAAEALVDSSPVIIAAIRTALSKLP
jgi:DNA-binding transcriptional LysR family regulator